MEMLKTCWTGRLTAEAYAYVGQHWNSNIDSHASVEDYVVPGQCWVSQLVYINKGERLRVCVSVCPSVCPRIALLFLVGSG